MRAPARRTPLAPDRATADRWPPRAVRAGGLWIRSAATADSVCATLFPARTGASPVVPGHWESRPLYGMSTPTLLRRLFGPARAAGGRSPDGDLQPGITYRNDSDGSTTEVARILDVRHDRFGLVHVRFELVRQYQGMTADAGERMLAAQAFRKRFPQRMETPAP